VAKKTSSSPRLKTTIRKYLNEDCLLEKESTKINTQNYEFGFHVKYPKIKDKDGNGIGSSVSILKPKKKNSIEIATKIYLHEESLERFNNFDDDTKNRILWEISTFIISQNLIPIILPKNIEILIKDKLYFCDSIFSGINDLYHSIMKVTNSSMIVIGILNRNLGVSNNTKLNPDTKDSYFQ